ncbi:hypothetical protein Pedsa_2691 [Pseudopedobacter saltans DSM 12145]|uniref:Uncharacterized protein n=1 Tax=Pseudopedobacter saltans (strain ATCC 51119 / DSM 12145 / JCM 21818 / CCUG 39354 / LMG 10337 / NBRC 100064 / NCIMB 13643) TaxID=762903 RepID=F0S6X0_PSESL|nr:hypothetical protein [Pseudopedobacter saltans]ADY53233.1 hypothetical protein Pedsa_2691 [Pseudopedobacter saltans DSM 12145]
MRITLGLFFLIYISTFSIVAYSQDNQIQLKGIVPGKQAKNIQIVEQRISANIYRDYSYVECYYHLRNTGAEVEAEMGLPIMNFVAASQKNVNLYDRNSFEVLINNRSIGYRNIYIPNELREITGRKSNKNAVNRYYKKNMPGYAWRILFPENGELQLLVKYKLPAGQTNSFNYFGYQLAQSALWKGKIERTEVSVNLAGINPDALISVAPKTNEQNPQNFKWHYKNADSKDYIFVKYQGGFSRRNSFERETASNSIKFLLNNKKVSEKKIEKQKKTEIAFVKRSENQVNVFTKDFVLKSFANEVSERFPDIKKRIEKLDTYKFDTSYILILNGRRVNRNKAYETLYETHSTSIKSLELKDDTNSGKTEISIDTQKITTYGA